MAYTPTTWANGDTITAAGLNKMEQGIAGSVMLIHYDFETFLCDKTWQQVHDALAAGTPVYLMYVWELEETGEVYTTLTPVSVAAYMPHIITDEPIYRAFALGIFSDYVEPINLVANTANDYLEML